MSKRVLAAEMSVSERKLNRVMSWLACASNLSDRLQRRRMETLNTESVAGQDLVLFTKCLAYDETPMQVPSLGSVRVSVPRAHLADAVESQTLELYCDALVTVQGTESQLTLEFMRASRCQKMLQHIAGGGMLVKSSSSYYQTWPLSRSWTAPPRSA